jgi:hypothetical protein
VTAEVYDLVGYRVRVSASSAEDGAAVRLALSGFGPVASEDGAIPTFGLAHSGRDWHVQRDGILIQVDSSLAGAVAALEWHLVVAAIAHRHDSFTCTAEHSACRAAARLSRSWATPAAARRR